MICIKDYLCGGRAECICESLLSGKRQLNTPELTLLSIPTAAIQKNGLGEEIPAEKLVTGAMPGGLIIGYGVEKRLFSLADKSGAILLDLSLDEQFVEENASLSAEGALGEIICLSGISPRRARIGIIGLGRIGRELVRELYFLGSQIIAFSAKTDEEFYHTLGSHFLKSGTPTDKNTLCRIRKCSPLGGKIPPEALFGLDILINTAPSKMLGEDCIERLGSTRVFELASGNNLPEGIPNLRLGAIPSRLFPAAAANLILDAAERRLAIATEKRSD